jgi:hypothetical protein
MIADLRHRLIEACRRLDLDPTRALWTFTYHSPYSSGEIEEMERWDDATWDAHARLLFLDAETPVCERVPGEDDDL